MKKMKKSTKIFLVVICAIILFFLAFRVVIGDDTSIPGTSCYYVVGRLTHNYFGTKTNHCSYVGCKEEKNTVSGTLSKKDYNELKKAIKIKRKDPFNDKTCDYVK